MKRNEKSITVTIIAWDGQEHASSEFYISLDGCKKLDESPRKLILDKALKAVEQVTNQLNIKL
jgi:hypothetical protein